MAGLGKKGPAIASRELFAAMEELSKAALIDLVVDLAKKESGDADDECIAATIRKWHTPVAIARGDKEPKIELRRSIREDVGAVFSRLVTMLRNGGTFRFFHKGRMVEINNPEYARFSEDDEQIEIQVQFGVWVPILTGIVARQVGE